MTTDEYVPSDEQVRGRYCDGTYAQTGHTTEGEDFDAWLARVRRDAKAEGWQAGVNFALPNAETTWYPQHNPTRATETGDRA